jgi:tRNA G46 methylase TrmB
MNNYQIRNKLKDIIGKFLVVFMPKRTAKLIDKGITINTSTSLKDRLIRHELLKKTKKRNDFETLAESHKNYWIKNGKDYFSNKCFNNNTLENFFIPNCSFMIDLLEEKLKQNHGKYNTLVEIGTGDGTVLEYLSMKLPQLKRLVGIDLSVEQTRLNKKKFVNNKRLEFVASDGYDWIKDNGNGYIIILTSRGVLEYFTETRLLDFFNYLRSIGNVIFVAIEPTGVDHDYTKNPNSQIYGSENSFSHNYKEMFKKSGFQLWHSSQILFSNPPRYENFIGAKTV